MVSLVDVLILAGTAAITLAVVGLVAIPSQCLKVHAASKGLVLGVTVLMVGVTCATWQLWFRSLTVTAFLFLTTPIAAHAMIRLVLSQETDR